MERIRIDRWLWFARQTKSRSLAQKLVADGHLRINGTKISSSSAMVAPGDVLTIALHGGSPNARVRVLEVVNCGERRGPYQEALTLYRDLSASDGKTA